MKNGSSYLEVFLLTDPLTDVETSKQPERMNQVRTAAQTAALSNGLSCLAKHVARTEES